MKGCYLEKWLISGSVLIALLSPNLSAAQVVGDTTVPLGERSQVTGNPNFQIDGGARRGGNLFHSFSQFSIPTGGSAYFNNAPDIQNILTRVTGGSISNVDGLIRANGTANLFLLNPNGIIFGLNAQLNIGGSFLASTASSLKFADGTEFSATNPQTSPLLTVNVPIGLQFGQEPGRIAVQGTGSSLTIKQPIFYPIARGNATGLRVSPGKTLALVASDVFLEGGNLTAEGGRIELGSVGAGQVVSLSTTSSGLALSYQDVQNFRDIRLSQQALADASGVSGGSIQIQGNNILLADGSVILIQNQGNQPAGSITVNASQSLEVSGTTRDNLIGSGLASETIAGGKGADIEILTRQLVMQDKAAIATRTFSSAMAGNLTLKASDSVNLSDAAIGTATFNSGTAGNVTVSTGRLIGLNGGVITSTTLGSIGKGGDLTVNATESIELIGVAPGILRGVSASGGTASSLTAITLGAGNAGELIVNTPRLVLQDGGSVNTSTLATGDAGKVTINARESVEISGVVPGSPNPSFVGSSANVVSKTLQQFLQLPPVPRGVAGDVTINTGRLSVTNGALVNVSNEGIGKAGTLQVNANSIFLNNGGAITAASASGEGGNIDLNVRDVLLLRNNSQITTSAAGTGNGGNIRINTSSLVALPRENSDIRADSVNSRGGNVTINTSGLFGIEFRDRNTPLSDITATGASSELSGTVEINVQDVDPTRGLTQLPTQVVDASRLVAQGCRASQGSSFVVSGRGSLPPTPQQALGDDPRWRDWRTPAGVSRQPNASGHGTLPPSANPASTKSALVEATGWVMKPDGKVILTASEPNVTSPHWWGQPVNCDGS